MKFSLAVGIHKKARNQTFFDISDLVCKLHTEISKIPILKMQLLSMVASPNTLTSEINPEYFRSISQRRICKMPKRAGLYNTELGYMT